MILFLLARAFLLSGAWAAQEARAPVSQEESAPATATPADRRLESLFGGALVGVRDHEPFSETRGYRELLEALSRYGEDELRSKVVGRLDLTGVYGNPNRWRGQIVSLRALVVKLGAERLERPLGEHVDVYRAYVSEPNGDDHLVVDFLDEPPADITPKEDVVDVEGVFFRIVQWENEKGDPIYAPQLIARNLRKLDQTAAPRRTIFSDPLAQITLGAALAYLVVRVFLSMRKKPDTRGGSTSRAIRERANAPARPKPPPLS